MSQILKLKRGSLERLSSITGSLQKGEVIFASGSSNITSNNGSSIAFVTIESGSIQAVNRVMKGDVAPQLTASQYIGIIDGVPFYASGSKSLVLLSSSGNEVINLEGNISNFSASVASAFSASNASITSVTGDFSSSVATSFSASAASQTTLSSSFASSQTAQNDRLGLLEIASGSLNSFTSSINTTIKTKLDAETVVSGSSQIDITSTTNYTTFSSSIATSISASVAGATWDNLVGKPGGIVSGSVQVDITATTGFSTFSSSIETRISLIDGGTY